MKAGRAKGGRETNVRRKQRVMSETASEAIHSTDTMPEQWEWVERSVWTDNMLNALETRGEERKWYSLMDKVYDPSNLHMAYKKVMSNKGAAGIDGIDLKRYTRKLDHNQDVLHRELRLGSYRPKAVKRVYIDKAGSHQKRPLGIPCVRDRIAQTALKHVIEPIFENIFKNCSYGFRPGRSCKDALREMDKLLEKGYCHVVDADIEGFFDHIDHQIMMDRVEELIADRSVLKLIKHFLKQNVMDGMKVWVPQEGTPQGAVISPLLANLYLNSLDDVLQEKGHHVIRYADDFVILSRSQSKAEEALDIVGNWMEQNHLKLHPGKTHVVDMSISGSEFTFLGYRYSRHTNKRGQTTLHRFVACKSLGKIRAVVKEKTPRKHGCSLEVIIADVNRSLRGWFVYFQHASKLDHVGLDGYVRRRLRRILRKRAKRYQSNGANRQDHKRWPNSFFEAHGYYSLVTAHDAAVQSLRGTC